MNMMRLYNITTDTHTTLLQIVHTYKWLEIKFVSVLSEPQMIASMCLPIRYGSF